MDQQLSKQPEAVDGTERGRASRAFLEAVEELWDLPEEEFQALVQMQLGTMNRSSVTRRELSAAAQFAVTLDAQTIEPLGNLGNQKLVKGTLLTPDQDVMDMDATIPHAPKALPKE